MNNNFITIKIIINIKYIAKKVCIYYSTILSKFTFIWIHIVNIKGYTFRFIPSFNISKISLLASLNIRYVFIYIFTK